ncbi:MAG: FAD/NAD(P)-binding oxidoreductase [bacterium]
MKWRFCWITILRKIRNKFNINIYTPESQPMPTAGPEMGEVLKQILKERNIIFNPGLKLKFIDTQNKELNFENGRKEKFDYLIGIPPHRAPKAVKDAGLTNETGWVPVNAKILQTKYADVYALGDITTIKLLGRYKPDVPLNLPKAGVFAHYQAEVVAHNIISEINSGSHTEEFGGKGYCFVELGGGVAGYASGNFYAEPKPEVDLKKPSKLWHWGKVLFEKWWFWRWF